MKLRLVAAAAGLSTAITAMLVPALATAASDDCSEELSVYDPHDLVEDPDILLDLPTLIDVEVWSTTTRTASTTSSTRKATGLNRR